LGSGGDLRELDYSEVFADDGERPDEAVAGGSYLTHPSPEFGEQDAVSGTGSLLECALVPCVASQEHRDHVEICRQLMAHIDPYFVTAWDRIRVNGERCSGGTQQREPEWYDGADRQQADRGEHPNDERRSDQPTDRSKYQEPDVSRHCSADEPERLLPPQGSFSDLSLYGEITESNRERSCSAIHWQRGGPAEIAHASLERWAGLLPTGGCEQHPAQEQQAGQHEKSVGAHDCISRVAVARRSTTAVVRNRLGFG
jgi:hypothetical protein